MDNGQQTLTVDQRCRCTSASKRPDALRVHRSGVECRADLPTMLAVITRQRRFATAAQPRPTL
jgi:hypothetical protein